MTIRQVIALVNAVQDNDLPEEVKCRWISECEARIWSSVMLQDPMAFVPYEWQYDADRELLMPAPYDELYGAYLSARIYLAYHEAQNYQNAMTAYNKLLDQTSIWYAKTYDPSHGGCMPIIEVPTVVQGETVTVAFSLPYSSTALSALQVAVSNDTGVVMRASKDEMELSGSEAFLIIPQEQSLQLPLGILRVAIAGADLEGQRFEAWPPLAIRVVETGIGGAL